MQPAALYLIAVVAVLAIGCASVVALEIARPEGYNSQAAYTVVGIVTTVLTALLGIIKSVNNGQALEEVKQTAAVTAGKADRAAEKAEVAANVASQLAGQPIKADVTIHNDAAELRPPAGP